MDQLTSILLKNNLRGFGVGTIDWAVAELAPNEFSSKEDYIGLFESESKPQTFLSLEKDYQH